MTAHALVTGQLFRAPQSRTSKAGKPFITATLKAKDGDGAQWWKLLVFSETAQAELLRLSDGDALAVQGTLKVELYQPEGGEPRLSLSIVADHVLALRQPQRQRERKAAGESNEAGNYQDGAGHEKRASDSRGRAERIQGDGVDHFGDEIPF